MGTFVRVTLVITAALVALAALFFILKLLVLAAVVAAVVVGVAFVVRVVSGRRISRLRWRRVTTLTARR